MMDTNTNSTILDRSGPRQKTAAHSAGFCQGRDCDKLATGGKDFTIGTWNVRTLKQMEKLEILVNEMDRLRWNVVGISEMRWKGVGEKCSEDGHKIWFCGEMEKHEKGVGILVNKNSVKAVTDCNPVSSRIISIRIAAKPMNMTIIQIYAPTSDYADEEVEIFYYDLEKTIKDTPKKDVLIVQGDWNAKIGTDTQQWYGTAGKFGVGKTNDRGTRLLEFAKLNKLVVVNTLHDHKMSRRTTWHSPDGLTHNQIDYILISNRIKGYINRHKSRSFPGVDIGSDHDLVMTTIKIKISHQKRKNNNRVRYDLEKLKDPDTKRKYQQELYGRFAPLLLLEDLDEMNNELTTIVNETAEKILGRKRTTKRPWITNEVLNKCDTRRELKKKRFKGDENLAKYRTANKETKKEIAKAKSQWIEDQTNDIERNLTTNNTRKAYQLVKSLTKSHQPRANVINDKNGKLLTNSTDVAERWREYCEQLYNHEADVDENIIQEITDQGDDEDDEPVIVRSEVVEAVRTLKNNKSPGNDNIAGELIKEGGEGMIDILLKICNECLAKKKWPSKWTESVLLTIPKKGNVKICDNYRTISLISHSSKVLLKIIQKRINPRIEEILDEAQAGFRKDRSTTEQIGNIRILGEKYRNHQQHIFHNFIDFKKAFDRVWHDGLWHSMKKCKIGSKITMLIRNLYENAKSAVIINNEQSNWFKLKVGVRQGCILSPVLFNLFLECIMTEALEEHEGGVKCGGLEISNLRFADDIDLIASSEEELREVTRKVNNAVERYGMEISTKKSKIMVTGKDAQLVHTNPIIINGEELERVQSFKYLGSILTEDLTSKKEIRARIGAATSAMVSMDSIWKDKKLKMKVKVELLRAIVIATMLYGCESWTVDKKSEARIEAFDNKCQRRLLGITWREKRTNAYVHQQMKQIYGEWERLINIVKKRKLKWFGHICRKQGSLANTVLHGAVEGSRGRGRPQRVWTDDIKEWTGMRVVDCLKRTGDRCGWRKAVSTWVHQRPP